jgi:hypothetical protein
MSTILGSSYFTSSFLPTYFEPLDYETAFFNPPTGYLFPLIFIA